MASANGMMSFRQVDKLPQKTSEATKNYKLLKDFIDSGMGCAVVTGADSDPHCLQISMTVSAKRFSLPVRIADALGCSLSDLVEP